MSRTSVRVSGSLFLLLLIGLVGLSPPQVLSLQGPRGLTGDVFVRWGYDRLLWDWRPAHLDGLTCFNQFTRTSRDGFFCDAAQLTAGLAQDIAIYKQLLDNVFDLQGNPNPDIKRLVEQYKRAGKPIALSDLFMFTKEQIEFGKGNPDSNIMPYFIQRDRGAQEREKPLTSIRFLHAPKKDKPECQTMHTRYNRLRAALMDELGFYRYYEGIDSVEPIPDFRRLFQEHPDIYEKVANCFELPPLQGKNAVEPWKNFVFVFTTFEKPTPGDLWANPGTIPIDGSDPLADPEIVDLRKYGLDIKYVDEGGNPGKIYFVVSLEALLRHPECCPEQSLLVRLRKRLGKESEQQGLRQLNIKEFFTTFAIFFLTPNDPNLPEELKRYVRRYATNWRPEKLEVGGFKNGLNIPDYNHVRPLAPFDTPTSFVPGTFFGFNLIGDNYSANFAKDFVDYYSRPGNGFPAANKGHPLLDPSLWRFEARIGTGNAPRTSTGTAVESGLYDIDIGGTATFTDAGVEYKDVTIFLDRNMTLAEFDKATEKEPLPTEYNKNLLLRLPFDGPVGRQADGSFRRTDYGVSITYDAVPAEGQRPVVRLHGEGEEARGFDELVPIQGPGHVPLTIRASDAYQDVRTGRLFSLKPSGKGYRLEYTPSAPHLFALKATPAPQEPRTDLYYAFLQRDGNPLPMADYAAAGQTLNPLSLFNWVSGSTPVSDTFIENAQPGFSCAGWTTPKPAARLSHAALTDFLTVAYSRLDHPQRGDALFGFLCAKNNAQLSIEYFNNTKQTISGTSEYRKPAASFAPIGRYGTQDTGGVHCILKPALKTYLDLVNTERGGQKGLTCIENRTGENNVYWYPQHIFPTAPVTLGTPCR